ncbi:MAG TPA: acyl carrier protein [Clostridia bacterium]|nr:acyl carrier protein [Clostridia bacterium]
MTIQEKLNLLEELLDIEKDTLEENAELKQLSQWDSMAVIAVIAMFDEEFGKTLTPVEIKQFKTVKDIVDQMD